MPSLWIVVDLYVAINILDPLSDATEKQDRVLFALLSSYKVIGVAVKYEPTEDLM
jgi:hypothetical protein